ncbi:MAG: Cys-tRNA(Pro) deacylase [Ruminococcaceae bacterium]|nr:Cys-tRNA(Pro) deacylase [Oscillospiraceae bacterium]
MEKTNVMRILAQNKIEFNAYEYNPEETVGENVAALVGKPSEITFKTLVTVANTKANYVFVVPVDCSLDLKKAAKVVKVKSIEMIKQKDLLGLTGYVHGGCSPVGMKKKLHTVIHESANNFEKIVFSAGKRGYQVEVAPSDIIKLVNAETADIIVDN